MSRHALVKDGAILEWRNYAPNVDQTMLSAGKPRMLPAELDMPDFDPVRQVRTGPEYIVQSDKVIERYTVSPRPLDERKADMINEVIDVRTAKLASGFNHDFGPGRGVHRIGTTDADMAGWDEVTKFANAMVALGDTTTTIDLVTDTAPVSVTSMDWQSVLIAAGLFRQPIWATSFVLQGMISAVEDHDDLDAIDVNTGWPA